MSNSSDDSYPIPPNLTTETLHQRLQFIRQHVAQPIVLRGFVDPTPAELKGGVLIGNKYHAANVKQLQEAGVTAVLNCASGGISRLPVDDMQAVGIRYAFTNVRQDHFQYPILHNSMANNGSNNNNKTSNGSNPNEGIWQPSAHLQVARQLYQEVVLQQGGKILFFCVAGMNRSTCLGLACLMIFGYSLDDAIRECAVQRPFVLENQGFQVQLVQLEALLQTAPRITLHGRTVSLHAAPPAVSLLRKATTVDDVPKVEIELLIPGLCTMDVKIPKKSTIAEVKECLMQHANKDIVRHYAERQVEPPPDTQIAKAWLVLAHFGYDSMYDVPLETEAIELRVQLERVQSMFGLTVERVPSSKGGHANYLVEWTQKCRFALVIFSVTHSVNGGTERYQHPWTVYHEERPAAPATFLENNLLSTHLRAWDFVTGQAYASEQPIVFSYSNEGLRDRRAFMKISTSANRAQQFHAPGEGNILGMGANAIVHRVQCKPTSLASPHKGKPPQGGVMVRASSSDVESDDEELSGQAGWDAAVKRHFSLDKMLASLESSSEAGLAKRVRFANSLNPGRVLYFYGLGVAMAANMTDDAVPMDDDPNSSSKFEYKWEAILLARYEEEFSTYTMKRFMDDYTAVVGQIEDRARAKQVEKLQRQFTPLSVKLLLVSLLNAFRDLTLMGVRAFDFNHLNNVLISRDHRNVRLIDIDGNSKGSIQYSSEYMLGEENGEKDGSSTKIHKPSLEIDLNAVLPTVIAQLLLGKGRGTAFVTNSKSEIWHAAPSDAKARLRQILKENFYSDESFSESTGAEKHLSSMTEWFYAVLKKQAPWKNWTNDIYDAMRCIDHFPLSSHMTNELSS